MNILKKFPVALVLTLLVVLGCGGYAMTNVPQSTPSVQTGTAGQRASLPRLDMDDWVCDEAGVLSSKTEEQIRKWNRQFDESYYAYVTVAAVTGMEGWDPENYVYAVANEWGLASGDMILVMDIGGQEAYLYEGGDYSDFDYYYYLTTYVEKPFFKGDYDTAVLNLMKGLDSYFRSTGRTPANAESFYNNFTVWDNAQYVSADRSGSATSVLMGILILLVLLFFIFRAIDHARYNSWYRSYGYMPRPPVVFRPIFFWNRFSPPRMGGFGGARGPMGGGFTAPPRSGTGFSGNRPHGGSYRSNARPRSGGSGFSGHGGGFSSGSYNSRSHSGRSSFGGHGGGFSSGSRGGGFSGGSRGGGSRGSHGGSFGGGRGGRGHR